MSEKTIAEKLLIREDYNVLFIGAPQNYTSRLGDLPPKVTILDKPTESVDLIQLFVSSRKEMERRLERLKSVLAPRGLLWVTYPKGTSNFKADINRDNINAYAKSIGLQGVAMISIDETWSALRLKQIQ